MLNTPLGVALLGAGFGRRILLPVCMENKKIVVKHILVKENIPEGIDSSINITTNIEDILADEEIKLVMITTPHAVHEEHVRLCLSKNKHVLCEKPLSLSKAAARNLDNYRADKGKIGAMNYSFRFIPQRALIRDMIAEGTIGSVKSLSLKFHRNDFHIWSKAWYYDPLQAGALLLTGSHLIDSVRYLSGEKIVSVSASLYKSGDTVTGFIIAMKTDSDLDICIDVSHQIAGSGKHLIEVYGKDGCILLNEEEKVILRQQGKNYIYSIPERYYYGFDEQVWRGNPRLQPTACVIGKVLKQISTYKPSGLIFSEAIINQAIIESIILSDEQRKSIEVDYK